MYVCLSMSIAFLSRKLSLSLARDLCICISACAVVCFHPHEISCVCQCAIAIRVCDLAPLSIRMRTMQDLTVEDIAAAGIYALMRNGLGSGQEYHYQSGFAPPDPRDISECEGLLEVMSCYGSGTGNGNDNGNGLCASYFCCRESFQTQFSLLKPPGLQSSLFHHFSVLAGLLQAGG